MLPSTHSTLPPQSSASTSTKPQPPLSSQEFFNKLLGGGAKAITGQPMKNSQISTTLRALLHPSTKPLQTPARLLTAFTNTLLEPAGSRPAPILSLLQQGLVNRAPPIPAGLPSFANDSSAIFKETKVGANSNFAILRQNYNKYWPKSGPATNVQLLNLQRSALVPQPCPLTSHSASSGSSREEPRRDLLRKRVMKLEQKLLEAKQAEEFYRVVKAPESQKKIQEDKQRREKRATRKLQQLKSKNAGVEKKQTMKGFKRANDLAYLVKGYDQLEESMAGVKGLKKGLTSKQKQEKWNKISALKSRLKNREQLLTFDGLVRRKDGQMDILLKEILAEVSPEKAQLISDRLGAKWNALESAKDEKQPLRISEKGAVLRGVVRPRILSDIDTTNESLPQVHSTPEGVPLAQRGSEFQTPSFVLRYFLRNDEEEE